MHYGIEVVNGGIYSDPRLVVKIAQEAETAGWEGLWVWDHLAFVWGANFSDPWVTLSAVAASTSRLRLGTGVTPLARRRPQVIAHTTATLDILCNGRLVLGVGLGGASPEFTAFGEEANDKVRANKLDEGLDVLTRLWSGEEVNHQGRFYRVDGVTLAPLPVQRPRIPIWVGGESDAALRRASNWDGWILGGAGPDGKSMAKTPDQIARKAKRLTKLRQEGKKSSSFEIALTGYSEPSTNLTERFRDAGVTWWLESINTRRGTFEQMLERVRLGPSTT